MTLHIRFHGRGGTGVKLASRIVSRAAFLAGREVQDSPVYGAERRGAPVLAFTRIAREPIRERGYVDRPDVLVVLDASLLDDASAGVLDGTDEGSLVLVNAPGRGEDLAACHRIAGRVVALDVSSIVLDVIGRHVLSAAVASVVVATTACAAWGAVAAAVRLELAAVGLAEAEIAANVEAARRAWDAAPRAGPVERRASPAPMRSRAVDVPHLPARVAAPAITLPGTSAARTTAGWRVFRPVIDLARCTRCAVCFALCPEGAIRLDADERPSVDYDHCKGCLVCVEECPVDCIVAVREAAA